MRDLRSMAEAASSREGRRRAPPLHFGFVSATPAPCTLSARQSSVRRGTTTMRPTQGWNVQQILSALVAVAGLVLMAIKIHADSEPGAIPLALVLLGLAWHVVARWWRQPR